MINRRIMVSAIIGASLAVMLSTGIRQSFGLFLAPLSESLGTGREVFSLAVALNNLIYGLPLVGMLSDRLGPRWIIVAGGALYAAGMVLLTRVTTPSGLYLTLGVMIGLALSATTYVVVLGAVAQIIPAARQSRVFGIVTATGSSGMFVVPPLAQFLLSNFGWQTALMALAGVVALIMLIAFGLPGGTGRPSGQPNAPAVDEPIGQVLTKARRHSGYLLLTTGFFVCGFHVAFISTHLPAFLADREMPAFVGAAVLSLIGAFNIVGSVTFGWLGDQYPRKYLLSLIYFGRALVIALFLIFPLSQSSALIFGSAMGFLWLATVPLTSGMVARLFGTRYLSTLYGIVFLSHQLGAFLGVWLGGRLYDTLGSYNPVWYIAIALGLIAAVIHIPLSEKPAVQVQIA